MEGSLSWALKPIPALQGCPHTPIHVEELSGVYAHGEPVGGGRGRTQGERDLCPSSGLFQLYSHSGLRLVMAGFMYPQN